MRKIIDATFYSHHDFRKHDTVMTIYLKTLTMGEIYQPEMYFLSDLTRTRYVKLKQSLIIPNIYKALSSYDNNIFGFLRESDTYYHLKMSLRSYDGFNQYGRPADPNVLSIELDESYFLEDDFIRHYFQNLISLYEISKPLYGEIHEQKDILKTLDNKKWHEVYGKPAFYMVYWANFYGPETVEKNGGKDKFLNAPCWRGEELSDGGIMLILYPSPLNPASTEKRAIQNKVLEYFGLEPIDDSKLPND